MWDKASLMLVDAGNGGGPWHWGHGGWDWAMGFHGLVWLLFLALVVFAVVLLVRAATRGASPALAGADGRAAVAVLDARYARGEIDRDEYLERKGDLS
jgi:putative membrane protein